MIMKCIPVLSLQDAERYFNLHSGTIYLMSIPYILTSFHPELSMTKTGFFYKITININLSQANKMSQTVSCLSNI